MIMKFWITVDECTGCSACESVCLRNAIIMKENEYGFKVPDVDESICINCGKCVSACPIKARLDKKEKAVGERSTEPIVYSAYSLREDIRFESTSGGVFTEIAKYVLEKGGYVCGAAYDNDCTVNHSFIENPNQIGELRQSKYVQSDIGSSFIETKERLSTGKMIVFVGTPCQIAGLYSFLGKHYDNLITIEFICLGVNSPKAYNSWIKGIENRKGSKVCRVWFKYKSEGWRKSPFITRIDFADGTNIVLNQRNNYYMRGYLEKNLFFRPSCSTCKFMGLPRVGDITLGDFWGLDPEDEDDKGTSLVMINSELGEELFNSIQDTVKSERQSLAIVRKGNAHFDTPAEYNPQSKEFLKRIEYEEFDECIQKYLPSKSIVLKAINKIKKIIH